MPSKSKEKEDPTAADNTYIAATRALIPLVRDAPNDFPRVQEENVNYGFRRNLLGLKPIGLALVSACLVIDIAIAVFGTTSVQLAVTAGIQLLVLLMWLVIVNATWVFEAGVTYAERLFEALEKLDTAPKKA
jgi:flagellar biosynthesis protein FliQ